MKKVIRLTESDLVKIVNKVIEEQKITDKGPVIKKDDNFEISDYNTIKKIDPQNNFKFKPGTTGKYLGGDKIQIGVSTFSILTPTGETIQIVPTFFQYSPNKTTKFKFSTEPLDRKYGVTSIRLIKDF
jgi:hypothetical protein